MSSPPRPDTARIARGNAREVQAAALGIRDAAAAADGTSPFDEHTLLSLKTPESRLEGLAILSERDYNVAIFDTAGPGDERPLAFGHLDRAEGRQPITGEFAVHPQYRRRGHGRELLRMLIDDHRLNRPGAQALQFWSHGDQAGARVLAAEAGFVVARALRQLRRSLDGVTLPEPELPPGVSLRSFRPGTDDAAWLALNARAFAHHPEQGRTTQADLEARMAEPWFDPAGFLIAERDGAMVGFHWTKVHPAAGGTGGEPLGEVYVLGVDPGVHGQGLGRAVTAAGLRYLQEQGLRTVLLYVEADNVPALAVYHRLEFGTFSTDVMYRSPEPGASELILTSTRIPDEQ